MKGARAVDSPYMNTAECAEYLRLHTLAAPVSAIYYLIREHKLPHGRKGNLYLFDKREIDAWVKGFPNALEMARFEKKRALAS